eukprot:s2323_g22.t1
MVQLKIKCLLLQAKRFLEKPRDPTTHSFWLLAAVFEEAKKQLKTVDPGSNEGEKQAARSDDSETEPMDQGLQGSQIAMRHPVACSISILI